MKRLLLLLPILLLLLAGCGEDEYEKELRESQERLEKAKEDTDRLEEVSKEIDKTSDLIKEVQKEMDIENDDKAEEDNSTVLDVSEAKELLEYGALREGDSITNLVIEDGEIKVIVEIGDNDIIDDKSLLAEIVYSRAGEELLEHDGWEVLSIEFIDIGEVSLHRDEKESNEYGEYFPTEEIMKQLGN